MGIPQQAFSQPGPNDINQDYWDGYAQGQTDSGIVPSPAGASDYESYKAKVVLLFKPQADPYNHATNTYNVGYDNALMDAANWLWVNDPTSPHNIAS